MNLNSSLRSASLEALIEEAKKQFKEEFTYLSSRYPIDKQSDLLEPQRASAADLWLSSFALKVAKGTIEAVIPERSTYEEDWGYNQCREEIIKRGEEYLGK